MRKLLLAIPLIVSGCAAVGDMSDEQRVYGGTRFIGSQVDQPAVLGPCASCGPCWLFDLPLSFAVDTVLLPVTLPLALFRRSPDKHEPEPKPLQPR